MSAPPVVVLSMEPEVIPVMAKDVEVAPWREVLPETVRAPFALRVSPMFTVEEMVVEPVTASAVVVTPTAVSPPLNARRVVVALSGNG